MRPEQLLVAIGYAVPVVVIVGIGNAVLVRIVEGRIRSRIVLIDVHQTVVVQILPGLHLRFFGLGIAVRIHAVVLLKGVGHAIRVGIRAPRRVQRNWEHARIRLLKVLVRVRGIEGAPARILPEVDVLERWAERRGVPHVPAVHVVLSHARHAHAVRPAAVVHGQVAGHLAADRGQGVEHRRRVLTSVHDHFRRTEELPVAIPVVGGR